MKFPFTPKSKSPHNAALWIALLYAGFSLLWIFFSDKIVLYFVQDAKIITTVQMLKGWAFVIVTTFIIYILLSREINKLVDMNRNFKKSIVEQKRVEVALRESETQLNTLIHNIPGMVYRGAPDWSSEIISGSLELCDIPQRN